MEQGSYASSHFYKHIYRGMGVVYILGTLIHF